MASRTSHHWRPGGAGTAAVAAAVVWMTSVAAPVSLRAKSPRKSPDPVAPASVTTETSGAGAEETNATSSNDDGDADSAAEAEEARSRDETSEGRAAPEAKYGVTTVAEPSETTATRQPSGWVTDLELDGAFGAGSGLGRELERVDGITVRRRSGLGQPAYVGVRGGTPRQLAVHLNGVRIGAPAGVGFDVGTLSTSWIDSVEVYRGGAAAPWGSGALTGALNLRMKPPSQRGWTTTATSMAGSFGTVGLAAHAGAGGESIRGDVSASWRRSDGDFPFVDRQGTPRTRVNNHHRQLSAGATFGADLAGGRLTAALLHEGIHRGAPGPSEFQSSYSEATLERHRTVGTVGWSKKGVASPDWGVVDLELGAGLVHRPLHYRNPEGFLGNRPVDTTSRHTSMSLRGRGSAYFDFGNIAHLDVEFRAERYSSNQGRGDSTTLRADRQTVALGLSDELLVADDAVSLVAGLRTELVAGRERLRVPFIPSAGVIWRALDGLELKANLSRSHRVPDFDELYLRTATIRGNPRLEPERSVNADLGARFGTREGPVSGKLTLFWSHVRDMIMFLPQTAYLYRAQNVSAATLRGLEAAGGLELGTRFRVRGSYTFTDAHLDSLPSVQLAHRPRHRGLLSGRAELAGLGPLDALQSLELSATVTARSKVYLDNYGSLSNPPHAQLDLGGTIRPNETLTFGLQVRNVTNNRRGADYLQRPLPGRAFYASVRVREGTLPR